LSAKGGGGGGGPPQFSLGVGVKCQVKMYKFLVKLREQGKKRGERFRTKLIGSSIRVWELWGCVK